MLPHQFDQDLMLKLCLDFKMIWAHIVEGKLIEGAFCAFFFNLLNLCIIAIQKKIAYKSAFIRCILMAHIKIYAV